MSGFQIDATERARELPRRKEGNAAATNLHNNGVVDDSGKTACNVGCEEASRGIDDFVRGNGKPLQVFDSLKRLSETDLSVCDNKIRLRVEP